MSDKCPVYRSTWSTLNLWILFYEIFNGSFPKNFWLWRYRVSMIRVIIQVLGNLLREFRLYNFRNAPLSLLVYPMSHHFLWFKIVCQAIQTVDFDWKFFRAETFLWCLFFSSISASEISDRLSFRLIDPNPLVPTLFTLIFFIGEAGFTDIRRSSWTVAENKDCICNSLILGYLV